MSPEQRLARGAAWFYWVAGLSFLNAVLAASGQNIRMVMGLGLTELISALTQAFLHGSLGTGGIVFILACNAFISGIAAGFGYLGLRRQAWAMIMGFVLYLLDAGLILLVQDWYALAFHAYVLFQLFNGIKACLELRRAAPVPAATPSA